MGSSAESPDLICTWMPSDILRVTSRLLNLVPAPATSTGEEGERGSLALGKNADFIVMETDPFALPVTEIHRAIVRETWIGGRKARPMNLSTAGLLGKALLGPRKKI
jgi:hypothetical protein